MADYYTQYSFEINNLTPKEESWLEREIEKRYDEDFLVLLPESSFGTGLDGSRCLWFHEDVGGSEIDILAEMLQDFLKEFRSDLSISFSWASTCSKPRVDSFSGGAVFITSEDIVYMSTEGWIVKQEVRKTGRGPTATMTRRQAVW